VVVNQPGASGSVGTKGVLEGAKDGYTWAAGAAVDIGGYKVLGLLDSQLKDWNLFFAVANVNTVSANPNAPFKDFGQFLEALKKDGKNVPVGTAGLSSAGHNMMETIRKAAPGVEYRHVTYDGGNPAVLSTVSGETQASAQLLVEMSEFIKGKRLIPLAVQADKPVTLEGYGEIPPVTKWLPNMPAPLNYFGIWVPKGTPEPVVQTMDMIWKKKIANSEPLKKYAAARAALFTPISGAEAEKEAMKMVTQTVWLYFDAGKAKASPDTIGIARPQ
jgi:tripartite-type tricarboxylate transporter receptor subunit TctC